MSDSENIEILANGEARSLVGDTRLVALIEALELGDRRIAIEVNEELVPRSRFAAHHLAPGDRVEIVHAIGGG